MIFRSTITRVIRYHTPLGRFSVPIFLQNWRTYATKMVALESSRRDLFPQTFRSTNAVSPLSRKPDWKFVRCACYVAFRTMRVAFPSPPWPRVKARTPPPPFDAVICMQELPPHKRCSAGCCPPFMRGRLAPHGASRLVQAISAWSPKTRRAPVPAL